MKMLRSGVHTGIRTPGPRNTQRSTQYGSKRGL
jgi:hypothetical protein